MKKKIKSECKVVSKKGLVSSGVLLQAFCSILKANVSLSQRKRKKWKNQHQENKEISF